MGVLAHQRAAWGIKVDRPFTREEKKTWSQEERKMYKVGQQLQPCLVNASLRTPTFYCGWCNSDACTRTHVRSPSHTSHHVYTSRTQQWTYVNIYFCSYH
jgi:hypothetical protein